MTASKAAALTIKLEAMARTEDELAVMRARLALAGFTIEVTDFGSRAAVPGTWIRWSGATPCIVRRCLEEFCVLQDAGVL